MIINDGDIDDDYNDDTYAHDNGNYDGHDDDDDNNNDNSDYDDDDDGNNDSDYDMLVIMQDS